MILRSLPAFLGSLAAALVLGAGATQAAGKTVHLGYIGYLGGAPVLSLGANVSVPEGTRPQDGAYSVAADMATAGNLAMIYPFTQTLQASGTLQGHRAQPSSYRSNIQIFNRRESITLTYGANGAVGIAANPMTRQAQMAQSQGYANGTIDPASLMVAVTIAFAQSGTCDGSYALFDGVRRYDLVLEQRGFADLDPTANAYYAGSATECTATPELVAGFQQSALQANLYPQSARLWLAPAVAGFPSVPVRIVAQSSFGEMTLELTQVSQQTASD